ncbi:MAG TPA: hypothetical protein PKV16_05975 [Caldisericia bacterium]|nr:hypothetical protein [Caldisericia bacterium]HPF49264.1 hypothetical protein [Caldisericia bacterium]HPI84056.1 hypothetical protein [Caldisericia bacterium]HPQ93314.1 hypothetical protein [Caldisericia bacterium]HRV75304.1 hypothetical protein [Caldisericia bacterium]
MNMKKALIIVVIGLIFLSILPATAGQGKVTYGFITRPCDHLSPFSVETIDGYKVDAYLPKFMDYSKFYMGAEVSMEWDGQHLYVIDYPTPQSELNVVKWVTEVKSFHPESYEAWVTSPVGDVRIFIPLFVQKTTDMQAGSVISVTCVKSPWRGIFRTLSIDLISR